MKTAFYQLAFLILINNPAYADEMISLDDFRKAARSENLSLKSSQAAQTAAQEASAGISLPPPMVGLTRMQDSSGSGNGFEINQSIPFPTKISNDRAARKNEAAAKGAMAIVKSQEINGDAKLVYFRLFKAQEKIKLLHEKKDAITQHLKLARAASRSDSFMRVHLLKAENDIDLLENEITQASQEFRDRQIQAAEFLNCDPKTFKPIAKDFSPSEIPKEETIQNPPQLEVRRLELESLKARQSEAKASWYPDFNLRYRDNGGTPMSPRSTEIMVGASLPFVFFWEPQAASGKVSAERLQGEYALAQEKRQIESRRENLVTKAEALKKQIEQYGSKIIPRAEKRMRFVHNLAPRDLETLQDHRESMEVFPELKLKALDLREQYEETVSELEKYINGDLK